MRQLTSEAAARESLYTARSAIDELHETHNGCDWCCGGGDELLTKHSEDIRIATEWLEARGLAVPVHPEDCPVLNERFHQWVDDCNTFQAGWLDWYENNQPIY